MSSIRIINMYQEFYLIYFYLSLYIPKLVANSIILTNVSNFYSVFCPRYLVYFNLHLGQFLVQNTKFNTFIY